MKEAWNEIKPAGSESEHRPVSIWIGIFKTGIPKQDYTLKF